MEKFLCHTDSLLRYVFWFKQEFEIRPDREHIGTSIEWTDISERRAEFLQELVITVSSWVYGKERSKKIIDDRIKQSGSDPINASTFLVTQAFSKFRPGLPQGQFGELLLFNFIQHFFGAVPLLRKQRITTSVGHERFGADAIHFKRREDENIIILGESKCYKSDYKFKTAFETSLSSIIQTVKNFNSELNLYVYDDFIEPELEEIAMSYKLNTLRNVHFELVCLIVYNESHPLNGSCEEDIKESIKSIIETRCKGLDASLFHSIENRILERINYIIFPIWELDELLNEFMNNVGSK